MSSTDPGQPSPVSSASTVRPFRKELTPLVGRKAQAAYVGSLLSITASMVSVADRQCEAESDWERLPGNVMGRLVKESG